MPPNHLLRLTVLVILLTCFYINLVNGGCSGDDCSSGSNEEITEAKKKPSLLDRNKPSPGKAILTALFPFLPFDKTTVKPFEIKKNRKQDKLTKAEDDSDEDISKSKKGRRSRKNPSEKADQKISIEASSTISPEATTLSHPPIVPMSRSRGESLDVLVQKEISSSRMSDLSRPSIVNPLNSEESFLKEKRRGKFPLNKGDESENERGRELDEERPRYDNKPMGYNDGDSKQSSDKKSKKSKVSRYTEKKLEDAYRMTQVSQQMADSQPIEQHNVPTINNTKNEMGIKSNNDASKTGKSQKSTGSNIDKRIDSDYVSAKTMDVEQDRLIREDNVEGRNLGEFNPNDNSKTKSIPFKETNVNKNSPSQDSDELEDRPRRNTYDDDTLWSPSPERKSASTKFNRNADEEESEDEVEIQMKKKKKKKKGSRRSQSIGTNKKEERLERATKQRKHTRVRDDDARETPFTRDDSDEFSSPDQTHVNDEENTKRRSGNSAKRKYDKKTKIRDEEDPITLDESKTVIENEKKKNTRRLSTNHVESEETGRFDSIKEVDNKRNLQERKSSAKESNTKGNEKLDTKESVDVDAKASNGKSKKANDPSRASPNRPTEEDATVNYKKVDRPTANRKRNSIEENEFYRETSVPKRKHVEFGENERVEPDQHEDFEPGAKRKGKNKGEKTKFGFEERDMDKLKDSRSVFARKKDKILDSVEQKNPHDDKADHSDKGIKNSFRRADLVTTKSPKNKPTIGVDSFLTRNVKHKNIKRRKPNHKEEPQDEPSTSTSIETTNKESESDETVRKNVKESDDNNKRESEIQRSGEMSRPVKSDLGENRVMTGKKSKKIKKGNRSEEGLDADGETKSSRKKSKVDSDDSTSVSSKKKHVPKNRKSKQNRNRVSREDDADEKPNRSKKDRKTKKAGRYNHDDGNDGPETNYKRMKKPTRNEKVDDSFENEKKPNSGRKPDGSLEEEASSSSKRIQKDSKEFDSKQKSVSNQDMSFEEERKPKKKKTDEASLEDDMNLRTNKRRDDSIEEERLTTVKKKKQKKGSNRGGFIDSFESNSQRKKGKSRKENLDKWEIPQKFAKQTKLKLGGQTRRGKGSKRLGSNPVYDDIDDKVATRPYRLPHQDFQPLTYDNSLDSLSSSVEQINTFKGNINQPRRASIDNEQQEIAITQQRTGPISTRVAYAELRPEKRLRFSPDGLIEAKPGFKISPKSPLSPRHAMPSETGPSTFQDDIRQTAKIAPQTIGTKAISLGSVDSKLERSVKAADPGLVSKQDAGAKSALGQFAIMSPLKVSSDDTHGQGLVITDTSNSSSEEAEEITASIQKLPETTKPKNKKSALKEGGVISNAVGSFLSILARPTTPTPSR